MLNKNLLEIVESVLREAGVHLLERLEHDADLENKVLHSAGIGVTDSSLFGLTIFNLEYGECRSVR